MRFLGEYLKKHKIKKIEEKMKFYTEVNKWLIEYYNSNKSILIPLEYFKVPNILSEDTIICGNYDDSILKEGIKVELYNEWKESVAAIDDYEKKRTEEEEQIYILKKEEEERKQIDLYKKAILELKREGKI